jgi:hypothetical protein
VGNGTVNEAYILETNRKHSSEKSLQRTVSLLLVSWGQLEVQEDEEYDTFTVAYAPKATSMNHMFVSPSAKTAKTTRQSRANIRIEATKISVIPIIAATTSMESTKHVRPRATPTQAPLRLSTSGSDDNEKDDDVTDDFTTDDSDEEGTSEDDISDNDCAFDDVDAGTAVNETSAATLARRTTSVRSSNITAATFTSTGCDTENTDSDTSGCASSDSDSSDDESETSDTLARHEIIDISDPMPTSTSSKDETTTDSSDEDTSDDEGVGESVSFARRQAFITNFAVSSAVTTGLSSTRSPWVDARLMCFSSEDQEAHASVSAGGRIMVSSLFALAVLVAAIAFNCA